MKNLVFLFFISLLSLSFIGCNDESKQSKIIDSKSSDYFDGTGFKNGALITPDDYRHFMNEPRVALVIGNANYGGHSKLENTLNDAQDVKNLLKQLNFKVLYLEDGNRQQMEEIISEFESVFNSNSGGVAFFYYSGHGSQVKGVNYLIPIGARIHKENEVKYQAVNLNFLLEKFSQAKNRLNIAMLDSCRNNPYTQFKTDSQGMANATASGTFIGFATASGDVASENRGERNSIFTKHLLTQMDKPNLDLFDMFRKVTKAVKTESTRDGRKQEPYFSGSLDGKFYFKYHPDLENSDKKRIAYLQAENDKLEKEAKTTTKTTEKIFIRETVVDNSEIEALQKQLAEAEAENKKLADQKAKAEQLKLIAEQDKERIEAEKEQLAKEKALKQKLANMKAEKERLAREKAEAERQQKIAEQKRKQAEAEKERIRKQKIVANSSTNYSGKFNKKWNKRIFRGERSYSKFSTNLVKDNFTNLIWTKNSSSSEMTHDEAVNYCRNLSLDSYSDFRLPTINELYYLADRSKYEPAYDSNYFNLKTSWHWTNTTYKSYISESWVVYFDSGSDGWNYHSNNSFIVCVRDF